MTTTNKIVQTLRHPVTVGSLGTGAGAVAGHSVTAAVICGVVFTVIGWVTKYIDHRLTEDRKDREFDRAAGPQYLRYSATTTRLAEIDAGLPATTPPLAAAPIEAPRVAAQPSHGRDRPPSRRICTPGASPSARRRGDRRR